MPHPHTPNHLQSSPTPSAYTLVSLRCTLHKLAQPHHSCGRTKLRSMSNFPRLSPYVSGHHLFVFFSICHICLMHFHCCSQVTMPSLFRSHSPCYLFVIYIVGLAHNQKTAFFPFSAPDIEQGPTLFNP